MQFKAGLDIEVRHRGWPIPVHGGYRSYAESAGFDSVVCLPEHVPELLKHVSRALEDELMIPGVKRHQQHHREILGC